MQRKDHRAREKRTAQSYRISAGILPNQFLIYIIAAQRLQTNYYTTPTKEQKMSS